MNLLEIIGKYTLWANQTTFDRIKELTIKEYQQVLGPHNISIKNILSHLAEDTWGWYHGILNSSPEKKPNFVEMTLDEVTLSIQDLVDKWLYLLDNKPQEIYEDEVEGKKSKFDFNEFAFNIFNHFTYHRGQIAMGLRILGKEVVYTDYVPYRFNFDHGLELK